MDPVNNFNQLPAIVLLCLRSGALLLGSCICSPTASLPPMWPTNATFQFEDCATWILRGPAYIEMHRGPASSLSSSDKILAGYTLESVTLPFYELAFIFSQRLQ